ncbi:phosphatidate cytidylyltransferase [Flavobacterium solisilvae]|uniref:Phosphatidate cytidylyltransferase n=1 Tax=Flavobacterium solisilvae TaxID=1852019 RepID=A0ABX1QTZ6_9FLAO|nr:phosphatidate cytidylyltransferase [Flavobacterium solisilvae]NMH25183.1 phosphatidate cytidylyltransferase [Flavobacterium solisilvae]
MNSTLTRAISGAVYIVLLISATFYSSNSFLLFFGILLLIAVSEFCKLVNLKNIVPMLIAVGLFILCNLSYTIKTNDILILLATLLVSIKALFFLFDKKNKPVDSLSKYAYLIGYIILPFVLITKIPFVENSYNPNIILSIFILIWVNDTFAFLVGKTFGKHKLFEKVSPKKTIEGFVGGFIFSIVAGIILAQFLMLQSYIHWIFIAVLASVFGTLGDLVESKFKRIANVKDSGTIMPGHGGVLDRLDSIIFVAPIVFLFYQIIYYVS